MLSIFVTASSRSGPRVRAEGSLKVAPPAGAAAGAGVGVVGAFNVLLGAGAGAAGAAGVWAVVGAGVEGAFEVDEEAVGAAFGFINR